MQKVNLVWKVAPLPLCTNPTLPLTRDCAPPPPPALLILIGQSLNKLLEPEYGKHMQYNYFITLCY